MSKPPRRALGARTSHFANFVVMILTTTQLVSCTTGTLYVSHPQVHTRERLVSQRQREQMWLLDQLEETDKITTTFQGLRDFREFAGFYNDLAISFNPAQGALDQITNDRKRSELQAELNNTRIKEIESRQALLKAIEDAKSPAPAGEPDATNGDVDESTRTQDPAPGTAAAGVAPPSSAKAQFKPDQALPLPKDLQDTRAKAHPIDLFNDKLAYRDTVNAAIKSNQLDDSHDFAGRMLYELTLSVGLTPGNNSQQFGQVELEIQKHNAADRFPDLARLFEKWIEELRINMGGDIGELQNRVTNDTLTDFDKRYLIWFLQRFGPGLQLQLSPDEKALLNVAPLKNRPIPKLPNDLGDKADPPKDIPPKSDEGKKPDLVPESLLKGSQVEWLESFLVDSITRCPDKDKEQIEDAIRKLRRAAAVAIWGSMKLELDSIVSISPPKLDNDGNLIGGLVITAKPAFVSPPDWLLEDGGRRTLSPEDLASIKLMLEHNPAIRERLSNKIESITSNKDGTVLDFIEYMRVRPLNTDAEWKQFRTDREEFVKGWTGGDEKKRRIGREGVVSFAIKLFRAEQSPHALTVYPREQAQSISEAAARETVLNLLLALNVMVPNSGVNANNQSQYLERAQTYLHAITRQPLLVGYGSGAQRFGWFLGPAFAIENGKASFIHRVIRHDVSATIVAPAWNDRVALKGHQSFIDSEGRSGETKPLWGGESIMLSLRVPDNAARHITQALLANSIAGGPNRQTSRPHPVIEYPPKGQPVLIQSVSPLVSGELPQTILILGKDLWRHPQVFIGTAMADKVEVLSNMEGLQAKFNRVPYPGVMNGVEARLPMQVDLTVVTSFGRDQRPMAVRILPPIELPKAEPPPVPLVRTFVDDGDKALAFTVDRPVAFSKMVLAYKEAGNPQAKFVEHSANAVWAADGKSVSFELGARPQNVNPMVYVAELRIYAQPNSDSFTILNKGGQPFAWFKDKAERSVILSVATPIGARANTIHFDVDEKTAAELKLGWDSTKSEAFFIAYPSLKDAITANSPTARISIGEVGVDVPLTRPDASKPHELAATKAALAAETVRLQLTSAAMLSDFVGSPNKDLKLAVAFTYPGTGKVETLPTSYGPAGNPPGQPSSNNQRHS